MDVLGLLIPVSLFLGLMGLGAFFWLLKRGQFDDPKATRTAFSATITRTGPRSEEGEKRPPWLFLQKTVSCQGPKVSQDMLRAPNLAQARSACSSVMPANRAS
jgi:cbb3-type cytochrome oxidase maturation protein